MLLLIGVVVVLVLQAPQPIQDKVIASQPGLWEVTKVVDGDTIDVAINDQRETVRFIGIDTPETKDPRKQVQCFGQAASAHSHSLLDGKYVRLEPDPTNSDRDKYHRLLRYVYLPDGTLVNAVMIRDGYAFAYTVFPFERSDEFRALESEARTSERGLWGSCSVDDSKVIKQTTGDK
jgi:micrococcal nuclease